ncbi:phosphopentomutase [Sporanaerobium hydrogeniformans]|uniref:Phosphopentomutase n=1 Tax=Sporanaerobium hydrogeniformans TaxID=3072179 RepID=A0AC61DEB3_9FIRM|nr:phosphopentomutase [Sporanaerobium hydrogeniformans]PHV71143.1 phosphopentomutase [Sporanaerobium hydrogeniformans]
MKRVIWIVLDSVGIGAMPDAKQYGDEKANTFSHVYTYNKALNLKHLKELGWGNIDGIEVLGKEACPKGAFARLGELSKGKDTTTGHWEMIGIYTEVPFPTYPNGFPKEIMEAFEKQIGTKTLGNCTASGTAIIEELGEEHVKTGYPIVYTSADSVFQIAAHEDIIPLKRLYEICEIARRLLKGKHEVARVIARPFKGEVGSFTRTANRRDFAICPPKPNLLTYCEEKGVPVMAVGKIEDIFNGQGITEAIHTKSNLEGVEVTLESMKKYKEGLIFTNLVDFDMKWGHRNDAEAYGKGLEEFDAKVPELMEQMTDEDILIITADHGCDPTTSGTDHTREYVPLLIYGKGVEAGCNLGTRKSFADIGQTVCEIFNLPALKIGESFLKIILKK